MPIEQVLHISKDETAFKIGQGQLYHVNNHMPEDWSGPDPENFFTIASSYSIFAKNTDEAYRSILKHLSNNFPEYGSYDDIKFDLTT